MSNIACDAQCVVNKLIENNMHISFAESCTGGMCCSELVAVADASKVLDMSFTTYANSAKVKLLGVKKETIEKYGVVSEQTAGEMAAGVCVAADCEVGVAVSGIAGPTGATPGKPVGMVCFGFSINKNVVTFTENFSNIGRNNVRRKAAEFVFLKLNQLL